MTEPGADPMAVGARLLDLFDRLQAAGQVVVLAIDDLQWADRPSIAGGVVCAAAAACGQGIGSGVHAGRGGADPSWARFVGGDPRTRVRLGGLSSGDLTELASALGLGALSQRGASRLATHTQGNALYCRALLDEIGVAGLSRRGMAAAGTTGAVRGDPRPRGRAPDHDPGISGGGLGVGAARAGGDDRSVARLPDARTEVDAAVAAGLLADRASEPELTFAHPLYRAAIYADLSPTTRRELHARAAEVVAGHTRLTTGPRRRWA